MATKKATKSTVENTVVTLLVVKEFIDKNTGEHRKVHTVFEADQERAKELIELGYCTEK